MRPVAVDVQLVLVPMELTREAVPLPFNPA